MMENSDYKHRLVLQIVARLKQIRKQKHILQNDVRYDLEINIGRIESGQHCPSLFTLARLCGYYGVSLHEFFQGIEISDEGRSRM